MKIIAKFKIFKLQYLRPGKGFRGPLKGYLSEITYIFVRPDFFGEFSKFEVSRSNFLRKKTFFLDLESQKYFNFYGQKYLGDLKKVRNELNNNNYAHF